MALEREVRIWLTRFSEILSTNEIGADNLLDLTFGDRVGIQWAEGTEHLAKKTFEELYGMLGLEKTMRILGMVEEVDSLGVVNRWDDPEAWQETSKMPFALSWFQVTGIVRMMEIAFKQCPHRRRSWHGEDARIDRVLPDAPVFSSILFGPWRLSGDLE